MSLYLHEAPTEWVFFLHIYEIAGFVPLDLAKIFVPSNNWDGSIIDLRQRISKGFGAMEMETLEIFTRPRPGQSYSKIEAT
jgi:hypothetical protein